MADLYAGSGALGLEALSRGARSAVLVERDRRAAAVCSQNARAVARALGTAVPRVITRSVDQVLDDVIEGLPEHPAQAAVEGPWDLVLADPPYPLQGVELEGTLARIARTLVPEGLLVLERSSRSPEPLWPEGLELLEPRRYGETVLFFCQRPA